MIKDLEEIFGIPIKSCDLFRRALTHSSYTKEKKLPYVENYERLEFLGDAVLKLTISDVLYKMYPESAEGEMSRIRSIVVSDSTLARIAKSSGLNKLIILAEHEKKQGAREIESICACVFEAILGAYYLDGEFDNIIKYIKRVFIPYIEDADKHFEKYNAKAILQEYTQGLDSKRPEYNVIKESQHKKYTEFEIEVRYNGEVLAVEKGLSKKEAEQKCAYNACKKLGII